MRLYICTMHTLRTTVTGLLLAAQAAAANDVTVAFGSCLRQWKSVPILDTVRSKNPAAFIFTGDNMYSDTGPYRFKAEPERIGEAYRQLARVAGVPGAQGFNTPFRDLG